MTVLSESKFEDLISELSSRSKMDRQQLLLLIQEKKTKVGGGYLTDQGALFLVASDLGVSVDYDHERPPSISKLVSDQKMVSIIARLISVGVPKSFTRKADSSKGLLTKLSIYDNSGNALVSLWESAIFKILDPSLNVRPGDLFKISEAYTRSGLDGNAELNVGERGRFEKLNEDESPDRKIDTLDKVVSSPSTISEGGRLLVVRGKVNGEVKRTSFSRSDGTSSDYVAFSMSDELGSGPTRVVIWNNQSPIFEKIHDGDVVTLLNVRTKVSTFQNSTGLEIHGDENTGVREYFEETRAWMLERARSVGGKPVSTDQEKKTSPSVIPFISRVIAIKQSSTDGRFHLLLVDSQKRKISAVASDEAAKSLGEIQKDTVVICKPESVDYATFRATFTGANSISKVSAIRTDIPLSAAMFVKVEDLSENSVVSLELICLSDPINREVQTKDGLVRRTDLTVADHTGELKVYGWRALSKVLEGFSAGDRIFLEAVEVQSFEGKKFLVLKNYSTAEKKAISG
ncbi:MAG TPA: hypothetical protein VN739_08120 [Nitrososphaerales archaeon]|nr:hypothetical protein [Nitrososphaerales archaeon]